MRKSPAADKSSAGVNMRLTASANLAYSRVHGPYLSSCHRSQDHEHKARVTIKS